MDFEHPTQGGKLAPPIYDLRYVFPMKTGTIGHISYLRFTKI